MPPPPPPFHRKLTEKINKNIKHFLIQAILYEGSTLNNFGFLIKEDLICGFAFCTLQAQMSVMLPFVYNMIAQSKESRKVDAITSILRKIPNPLKFEPFLRFRPNLKMELPKFYIELWTISLKT